MIVNTATILEACAFIVAVGGAGVYLRKMVDSATHPLRDINRKLDADKRRLEEHEEQIRNLKNDMKEIMLSQNVMLSHMVTNNNTGELKKRQDELNEYLIRRT